MFFGYNTNGFAHHSPESALQILSELGYGGVGLTIDHHLLNPYLADLPRSILDMQRLMAKYELRSVIETGARFLLDPARKHEPTLVTADTAERRRRVDFLCRAIDIATELRSDAVSLWSGIVHQSDLTAPAALDRLVESLKPVIDHAAARNVMLAFEPEPGMLIDTMDRYAELAERITAPHFKLTLDIGHLHCLGEVPIDQQIVRWQSQLVNVHIEDMKQGVHEHLMFAEGEIDFAPVLRALRQIDYQFGVYVELSRHSHMAPEAARRAMQFLTRASE
ncbi:MAG: sugar phosphate isomerase/epimerase family protein [Planctomycetota bacterium]|nr:sugar phosphate isomerase/epimerase family protein [Planctomycetota bacterium]